MSTSKKKTVTHFKVLALFVKLILSVDHGLQKLVKNVKQSFSSEGGSVSYLKKRGWLQDSKGWYQSYDPDVPKTTWHRNKMRSNQKEGITLNEALEYAYDLDMNIFKRKYIVKYLVTYGCMTVTEEDYECYAYTKWGAWKQWLEATKNESHYACREYRNSFLSMKEDITRG